MRRNGNTFISSYFLTWYISGESAPGFSTFPGYPAAMSNGYLYETQSDCIEPGGIYHSYSDILNSLVLGRYVGCSTIETLSRSTLECLSDQTCVDLSWCYGDEVPIYYGYWSNATVMSSSLPSRFMTILQRK